jgi:glycosyltransferase involved in cell wall biosynthesis
MGDRERQLNARHPGRPLRVLLAGTFDPQFHRNRILLDLLRRSGLELRVCHVRLWGRREEHVILRGKGEAVLAALRAYPQLLWKLMRAPRADVILVAYPGHFDVPLIKVVAWARGVPIIFDKFISLFDTVVSDRGLRSPRSPVGRTARLIDRLSCRLADRVLADTPEHAQFFARHSGVEPERFRVLWVGAEDAIFHPHPERSPVPRRVLFYGSFVPLHGVEWIVRAARLLLPEAIELRLIGTGQDHPRLRRLADEIGAANIRWIDGVPLDELPLEIASATLCLGIFGATAKAGRVIPNKLFQCVAVGRPVLSGETPALRSAFAEGEVAGCAPADPAALALAIRQLIAGDRQREAIANAGYLRYHRDYSQERLAELLARHVAEVRDESVRP